MNPTTEKICGINAVEGFDPASLALDYVDLATGETRKRLPVMAQIAWFRLKYPEGRIAVSVKSANECFVATAQVYAHYNDPVDNFLAEASAARGQSSDKPSVSPREWAQTAAIGIALRNAGFGLQFHAAGESFDGLPADELPAAPPAAAPAAAPKPAKPEPLTYEKALLLPCPIAKYKGKTLGDMITVDPGALTWIATKFRGDQQLIDGAKRICEQAVQQAA